MFAYRVPPPYFPLNVLPWQCYVVDECIVRNFACPLSERIPVPTAQTATCPNHRLAVHLLRPSRATASLIIV